MEKKYQIFISSTYEDLKEERKKVQDTILSMYQFPIGMEMFSAADEEQWEIIRETIDSSDYYVLIVGHRYGSVIEEGEYAGISYTQKEFRYALEQKIPILAFLIDNSVAVTLEKTEQDVNRREKLEQFKDEVKSGRMIQWWTSKDDLANKVMNSLNKQIHRRDRLGWIRADGLDLGETQNELVKMSKRIKELDEENKQLKRNATIRRPISNIFNYDIAVICALKEEIENIKDILSDVERVQIPYDNEIYYCGYFIKGVKKVRVVLSYARQMGMVAAAVLTTKVINNFTPKYLVMTGIICGTKPEKMCFGDIIVASSSWDYGAGTDIRDGRSVKHLNSLNNCTADNKLINWCRNIQEDVALLYSIKDSFKNGLKPNSDLRMLIGPVVSGSSIVMDSQIVHNILQNQDKDIVGIEREIYGFYYAASWANEPRPSFIALKSVSDFADYAKSDNYHPYAAYTSAKVFKILAQQYFEYDD